jgi:hypothetical protein
MPLFDAIDTRISRMSTTVAWAVLVTLSVSAIVVAVDGRGVLPWVGWIVALLVWIKARVLALSYLELCHAAPVFQRIVTAFSLVVPVALALVAWWER